MNKLDQLHRVLESRIVAVIRAASGERPVDFGCHCRAGSAARFVGCR